MIGTKEQYALKRGCSKAYLSKPNIIEILQPAMVTDPDDGKQKIDFEIADKIFEEHADPARVLSRQAGGDDQESGGDGTESPSDSATYAKARAGRELIKLRHEELDLAKRQGETVSRREVKDACARAGQQLQERLMGCSRRMAERFATMTDPSEIKVAMENEFRVMLESISDDFARKFSAGGESAFSAAGH